MTTPDIEMQYAQVRTRVKNAPCRSVVGILGWVIVVRYGLVNLMWGRCYCHG